MSRRDVLADLQDAALKAGAVSARRGPEGGRHPVALLIVLPSGATLRYPVANKARCGHGKNYNNAVAGVKRLVRDRIRGAASCQ